MAMKKEESFGAKRFLIKTRERDNKEPESLIQKNVKKGFDSSVQCNENEGEIEGVSPILRVRVKMKLSPQNHLYI